jgi:SAM-dependent methyltransferase
MSPETSAEIGTLASKDFWEEEYYWASLEPPCRPDPAFSFDRCLAQALEEFAPVAQGSRVLEVGCAPAKWLVFYGERFGAYAEGIEYSERGAALSRENLDRCGVRGAIRHADFFDCEPALNDLVLSIGFIEHFDDLEGVFARHLDFLAPDGRLILGVPNFRGLNRLFQQWSDPRYLRLHNLRAMDRGLYERLAEEHGLVLERARYIGGFDPAIIKLGRKSAKLFIHLEGRYRRLPIADRINHRWGSSYLLTSFRRTAAAGYSPDPPPISS